MTTLRDIFNGISSRHRPEDVAMSLLECSEISLNSDERSTLQKVGRSGSRWSSMSNKFVQADDLAKQIGIAKVLFPRNRPPANIHDPVQVGDYLNRLQRSLRVGGTDFKSDRLNRDGRRDRNAPWRGGRAYNKRFRLVSRMAEKYNRWQQVANIKDLAQIAKVKLATRITWDEFRKDPLTAGFVAYLTARLGLRSQFTWGAQKKAFDDVCNVLWKRLVSKRKDGETTNWFAIAHVYTVDVVERLSDDQKGQLLGCWFDVMKRSSDLLGPLARSGGYDLQGLVVRRGNDSSTWNEAAGAFNKARDGWVATLYAMGAADVLDKWAVPKGLRLMAADVVYMHRNYGSGGLEPDTMVWNDLPKPWDVMDGQMQCNRALIEATCARHGVHGKGWIAPRPKSVEAFTPTPELVHGVTVSSPDLAKVLRSCGYFSGPSKGVKRDAGVPVTKVLGADGQTVEAVEGFMVPAVINAP